MKNRPFLVLVAIILVFGQFFSSTGGLVLANNPTQGTGFGITPLKEWKETAYKPQGDELPINLEMVENPGVTGGFTKEQTAFLSKNGFVVMHTGEEQFGDIRQQISTIYGQPYYLTTDAAFHTLHINFDALLKQLEKTILKAEAAAITSAVFEEVSRQANTHAVDGLDIDMQLALDYMAVALVLFDEDADIPAELRKRIQPQVDQVMAAEGRSKSVLIPNFEDDYGAYKPVGHYAGDPELECYFRGMTWAGRVAFKFRDSENPKFTPSLAPLIITRAMRLESDAWARYIKMMETLSFIIGPTDDAGPVEVLALMDTVYGRDITLENLADDQTWQKFLARVDELPQPQINSTFANSTKALKAERSWRMMGQRFTLDALMFQNLIYDRVGSDDNKRQFPSGLDVMAVLGSKAALEAQKSAGEDKYENYLSQLEKLQSFTQSQKQAEWLDTFYSGWLYSFIPQVQPKGTAYPPVMQTAAWQNREANSALGSWAELKHDTALYAKMPEFMAGGGPPGSPSAPGYVEPNPNVFYRLAYVSRSLKEGLELRGYIPSEEEYTGSGGDLSFMDLWRGLDSLANQFTGLGDIAVKELEGRKLAAEDFDLIQSPLGAIEDHVEFANKTGQEMEMPPVPVISAVSGADNEVLEAGVGNVDRIFVVVTINGQLQIAQGGIFTYYEFRQPRSNRLTDEEWRRKLAGTPPGQWAMAKTYTLNGGKPVDTLAFRIGDVYLINEKGGEPPLNMRSKPSKSAAVIDMLKKDTYIEITAGPEQANSLTWWKIKVFGSEKEGWVAENPTWYDRAHGQ